MKTSSIERVNVLGTPVDCIAPKDLESALENLYYRDSLNQRIVFVDHKILLRASYNPEWLNFISDAALVIPLNYTVTNAIKVFYKKKAHPYLPLDVLLILMNILEKKSATIYLLGARPDVLQTADLNLKRTYPGLRFIGRHAGYFNKKTQSIVLESIRKSYPSLLIASRGLKEKELWLYRYNHLLKSKIFLFCGDCFDIFANRKSRPSLKRLGGVTVFWTLLIRPWTLFRIFHYLRFHINLIVQNFKKIKVC